MTMTKHSEQLPRPAAELERLAEYYETHDTSTEMDNGDWVEPQPMATTSLRLPADVIDQLKQQARIRQCGTRRTCGRSLSAPPAAARHRSWRRLPSGWIGSNVP